MTVTRVFENEPENKIKSISNITLILAHGAGAPADSEFMKWLSGALAAEGIATVRFEFPYMTRRREDGRKRPPDRQPVLLSYFREVIQQTAVRRGGRVFVGGKSMGGRMASLLAAESDLADILEGCICFGYPFHPPGKTERWRVEHFDSFCTPVMIIQGTRDPFGKREEVERCESVSGAGRQIYWLEGGNHDFKPLARQAETQNQLIEQAAKVAAAFMGDLC